MSRALRVCAERNEAPRTNPSVATRTFTRIECLLAGWTRTDGGGKPTTAPLCGQASVSRHGKCYRRKGRRAKTHVTEAGVPQEGTGVGPQARREYVARMRERYVVANRTEKGRLLDEAVTVTGRHRKALIRAWRRPSRPRRSRGGRPTAYGPAVGRALVVIWTAAGYPWSRRLKALLPLWLPWARRRLRLTADTERGVRTISARQIDRVLAPHKRTVRRRQYGRTRPGTLLKHHIR